MQGSRVNGQLDRNADVGGSPAGLRGHTLPNPPAGRPRAGAPAHRRPNPEEAKQAFEVIRDAARRRLIGTDRSGRNPGSLAERRLHSSSRVGSTASG